MIDLFEGIGGREKLGEQAFVLRGFALSVAETLLAEVRDVESISPLRHMETPGGFRMSVATTNCGTLGWISDRRGYKYAVLDPITHNPWPSMPEVFLTLATSAAGEAGFNSFVPNACLINQYIPGTKLSLHQDKDERDFSQPIVSVSLGVPATFQFGGFERPAANFKVPLFHGDVVVWGGVDRLRYHGILPLKRNDHALLGEKRINLTFRWASLN